MFCTGFEGPVVADDFADVPFCVADRRIAGLGCCHFGLAVGV